MTLEQNLAVSTHWNAARHNDGEAMAWEIAELTGIRRLELGYDLTVNLVPGVKKLVASGDFRIASLHNFCPVPIGAPRGHPELFSLASLDSRVFESAILHTRRTIEFAAEVGAPCIVVHGGNVEVKTKTVELMDLAVDGRLYSTAYEKAKLKLFMERDRRVKPHLDQLRKGLAELLPALERHGVTLCLENLPTWESLPTEAESETILREFNSPRLGVWYDIGHGQIRQNLGFVGHVNWFKRLTPSIRGMHIHDVTPPARDHVMPPKGHINFQEFAPLIPAGIPLVVEPSAACEPDDLRTGVEFFKTLLRKDRT